MIFLEKENESLKAEVINLKNQRLEMIRERENNVTHIYAQVSNFISSQFSRW
jgi:hypothetical protein